MSIPIIESVIDAVTVYRSGALISRVATLAAGDTPEKVRLIGLPLSLDDSSLRVQVECDGEEDAPLTATGLSIALESPEVDRAAQTTDEDSLNEARREQARVQDRIEQLDREMDRLKRLKVTPRPEPSWDDSGKPRRTTPGAARLELLAFQRKEQERLLDEIRGLRAEKKRVSKQVSKLEARVRHASTARATKEHELRKTAVVSLVAGANRGAEAKLRLDYHVPGARWVPAYALQLDRARGEQISTNLSCRAMVCQKTGEDWNDVDLTLTTAAPQTWCELPELQSVRIGRWQPPTVRRGFKPPPLGIDELYADFDHALGGQHGPGGMTEVEVEEPTARYGEATIQAALAEADRWNDDHSVTHELSLPPAPGAAAARPATPQGGLGGGPPMQPPPPAAPPPPRSAPTVVSPEPFRSGAYDGADFEAPLAAKGLSEMEAAPAMEQMAKSAGLLSRFSAPKAKKVAVFRNRSEGLELPDVLPPDTPAEATLLPDDALLAYNGLHIPPMDHPRRGLLTVKARQEVYLELFQQSEVEVTFDVGDVVHSAWTQAREVDALSPPRGHITPRVEGGFAYAYPAEARVSLASDGTFHAIPLSQHSGDASLRHVSVPRESQDIYRFLELRNPLTSPLLDGPADIYVKGDYLLTTQLHETASKGKIQLGLGVEPSLKVSRNTEFSEETTGLIKGTRSLEHEIRIELVNHLGTAATIEVRERLPQAREEDDEIEVEVLHVSPAWKPWDGDDQPLRGGFRWNIELAADEKAELLATYQIRISAKYELVGGNRREA